MNAVTTLRGPALKSSSSRRGPRLVRKSPVVQCRLGPEWVYAAAAAPAAAARSLRQALPAAAPHHQRPSLGPNPWKWLVWGALFALVAQYVVQWLSYLPLWQRLKTRFIWWKNSVNKEADQSRSFSNYEGTPNTTTTAMVLYSDNAESVEWFNMCWRKAWRVYQRGLEKWLAALLQPVFDNLIAEAHVPSILQRLRILEFTLDHEAPYFDNMRRRTSRKDSDLNGVVDVRYTGGVRMLLLLEVGRKRLRLKIPVLVSDLDLECKMWLKIRLAPMCPWFGTVSLAFVGAPTIKVQLAPYNRVRLMKIPFLQPLLARLLTVDLPGLMVLPRRLEINIPPAVTTVAEAAVGHDAVMRAVASAVLQADALEHALMAALPLGPQSAAGGVSLPETFHGELQVTLLEARSLPVWGFPWQSNPWCRMVLGKQTVTSRRDDDTSRAGSHRAPVWNQEFQLLVESPSSQVLEVQVLDSQLTGRPEVGHVSLPLSRIPRDSTMTAWLPLQASRPHFLPQGELKLQVQYKAFEDDELDSGYKEAEAYADMLQEEGISDVKSAADASSRAAVAASAAMAAVAVTKAAAARAAAKASSAARAAKLRQAAGAVLKDSADELERAEATAKFKEVISTMPVDLDPQLVDEYLAAGISSPVGDNGAMSNGVAVSTEDEGPDPLQGIDPDDLFPGVQFRIMEDEDEDMPISRPVTFKPRTRRPSQAPAGSSLANAKSRGADAVRALQAQQKAGAGETPPVSWPPQDPQSPSSGEPSVGRGPIGRESDKHPSTVDAEVGMGVTDEGGSASQAGVMNPLTGQASVQSHTPPSAQDTQPAASTDADVQEEAQRTRSIFPWWQQFQGGESGEREVVEATPVVVDEVIVPRDLPLDAIAAEVQATWRLKEEDAERLVRAAVARSERPWLILLTVLAGVSAALLGVIFWQVQRVPGT
ncbi:hypothetical protein WJX73_000677 [Symbiochloris irregularis]|uniref:Uncharacterized protein n=1 Tax=Symbiochloris irregularis TaxID=706552 RepID=A0AAW1PJ88_9CHLO